MHNHLEWVWGLNLEVILILSYGSEVVVKQLEPMGYVKVIIEYFCMEMSVKM